MNQRFTDADIAEELALSVLGRRDMIERAESHRTKRSPETIARMQQRLAVLEAAEARFRELAEVAAR